MNAEQATQIHDLESYCKVTGAKRFKRTKLEMEAGLSPEEALKQRINWLDKNPEAKASVERGVKQAKEGKLSDGPKIVRKGDITLRPAKGVSSDYFEHVPGSPVQVILDGPWYGWFDTLMSGPFEGDANKLMQYILDFGIGEVHTKFHFPADIVEHERPIKTPNTLLSGEKYD